MGEGRKPHLRKTTLENQVSTQLSKSTNSHVRALIPNLQQDICV